MATWKLTRVRVEAFVKIRPSTLLPRSMRRSPDFS